MDIKMTVQTRQKINPITTGSQRFGLRSTGQKVIVVNGCRSWSVLKPQRTYRPFWNRKYLSYNFIHWLFCLFRSFMPKKAKNCQWCTTFWIPQTPFFCIREQNILVYHNIGIIWAYVHAKSQDIWNIFTDPIISNVSKTPISLTFFTLDRKPNLQWYQKSVPHQLPWWYSSNSV